MYLFSLLIIGYLLALSFVLEAFWQLLLGVKILHQIEVPTPLEIINIEQLGPSHPHYFAFKTMSPFLLTQPWPPDNICYRISALDGKKKINFFTTKPPNLGLVTGHKKVITQEVTNPYLKKFVVKDYIRKEIVEITYYSLP